MMILLIVIRSQRNKKVISKKVEGFSLLMSKSFLFQNWYILIANKNILSSFFATSFKFIVRLNGITLVQMNGS